MTCPTATKSNYAAAVTGWFEITVVVVAIDKREREQAYRKAGERLS